MKCRFEHDGDCCNSGATQYMCKCKKPCDTIIPLTNADRIRAMTDEELAKFFAEYEYETAKFVCAKFGVDITHQNHDFEAAAKELLQRLQQPAEGD